jgi:hypothetical protein
VAAGAWAETTPQDIIVAFLSQATVEDGGADARTAMRVAV